MIVRLIFFLLGFSLAVSGGISTIAYLNLLATGHGMINYLQFISTRFECYLLPFGLILISLSIYYAPFKKQDKF
ncbi:hypothetical protein C0966_02305 [Bacillus methanolicus]|uniref:hypothetical protein n=1 Tax=Bacillus methanolicus TaxID=1471 RepID=UPI00237FEB52|nr:hypothetical protein [Bacillus methanolicus]MDE3838218.1 hypothetical protein [Bacillus methanolicus]